MADKREAGGGRDRAARPRPTVQDLHAAERRPLPQLLKEAHEAELGVADLPRERYFSPEIHRLEMDKVWARAWQLACRLEDIPTVGDHVLYEIGDHSLIVLRSDQNVVKAFHNACLHRGRRLCDADGSAAALRCPFHGFTWRLDGRLSFAPCAWDFEHVDFERDWRLPEARVGLWGGFVFVCLDEATAPLDTYLQGLPAHFAPYRMEERVKAVHVRKLMPGNWKLVAEAFIESFHVMVTHPEAAGYIGDANSQYDVLDGVDHWNRMIVPRGLASPQGPPLSDLEIVQASGDVGPEPLPDALSARQIIADKRRAQLESQFGIDTSAMSDCEAIDTIQYFVFPNMAVWAGYNSFICYRWRPNEHDPDTSWMDVMLLLPFGQGRKRPPAAKPTVLGLDQAWTEAPQLGGLGHVFNQDTSNIAALQRGLKAARKPGVTLARYQESRIRHFASVLDAYLRR